MEPSKKNKPPGAKETDRDRDKETKRQRDKRIKETKVSKSQRVKRDKEKRKRKDGQFSQWAPTLIDSVPVIRIHSFQFCPR